jgi:hypothetical protein
MVTPFENSDPLGINPSTPVSLAPRELIDHRTAFLHCFVKETRMAEKRMTHPVLFTLVHGSTEAAETGAFFEVDFEVYP